MLTSSTLLQNGNISRRGKDENSSTNETMKTTRAKLNHGFSLFNMQICKVLVVITVVVANNMAIISKATCFSL